MNSQQVVEIRLGLGISQTDFAHTFKINIHTLRQWERRDSPLDSAVEAYLCCIQEKPEIISKILQKTKVLNK
jgi:DNA-binding transcriptional regulator YiaG